MTGTTDSAGGQPEASDVKGPAHDTLSGWAGIEHHLMKNDTGMVKNAADDIDSLLVFAGLFSGILTAFVVQTYPMLQDDGDGTMDQLLALGVAAQLRSATSIIPVPASLNDTLFSMLDSSPSFTPSTTSRWINVLFFTSLVFSLASAFFGILAKQWLREYIKWNKPLATPRENVLVRQMAFEAWEAWNVTATIASIPALLELAMILFLAGVVVLLWTLDNIVAIAVTTFVAIFLLIVSVVTILPIFVRRCPYKSPTAWACLAGYRVISGTLAYWNRRLRTYALFLRTSYREQRKNPRQLVKYLWKSKLGFPEEDPRWKVRVLARAKTWREEEMGTCLVTKVRSKSLGKCDDIRGTVRRELERDDKGLAIGDPNSMYNDYIPGQGQRISEGLCEAMSVNLSEMALLCRALHWVQTASQDERVTTYIDQCMPFLHNTFPTAQTDISNWIDVIHSLSVWCMITALHHEQPNTPHVSLLLSRSSTYGAGAHQDLGAGTVTPSTLRLANNVLFHKTTRHPSIRREHAASTRARATWPSSHLDPIILRMLAGSINWYLTKLQDVPSDQSLDATPEKWSSYLRRTFEMVGILTDVQSDKDLSFLGTSHYAGILHVLLGEDDPHWGKAKMERYAPGLRTEVFLLACKYAKVTWRERTQGERYLVVSAGRTTWKEDESLVMNYFDLDFETCTMDELNLFVISSGRWLRRAPHDIRGIVEPHHPLRTGLERIVAAAEAIFARRGRSHGVSCHEDADDSTWIHSIRPAFIATKDMRLNRRLYFTLFASKELGYLVGNKDTMEADFEIWMMYTGAPPTSHFPEPTMGLATHHRTTMGTPNLFRTGGTQHSVAYTRQGRRHSESRTSTATHIFQGVALRQSPEPGIPCYDLYGRRETSSDDLWPTSYEPQSDGGLRVNDMLHHMLIERLRNRNVGTVHLELNSPDMVPLDEEYADDACLEKNIRRRTSDIHLSSNEFSIHEEPVAEDGYDEDGGEREEAPPTPRSESLGVFYAM